MTETSSISNNVRKGRIEYLDLAKLVAIMLVIWGHISYRLDAGYAVCEGTVNWIYSFHMPLFMMVSGMFVGSSLKMGFIDLLRKKFKQLLLPVITCTLFSIVYFLLMRGHCNYSVEVIGNSWFLKTLFICYILYWLIKQIPLPDYVLCPLSCVALFLIPHAYSLQVNWLYPFMWGGVLLNKYRHTVDRRIGALTMTSLIIYVAAYFLNGSHLSYRDILISMSSLTSDSFKIMMNYIFAATGSIITLGVCHLLCRLSNLFGTLSKYGQYTLGVYILQTLLLDNVLPDFVDGKYDNAFLLNCVLGPLGSIAATSLCIALIRLISRSKILGTAFFGGMYVRKQ